MARPNPFAQSILDFISELEEEDQRSGFYKEVLMAGSRVLLSGKSDAQSMTSAQVLHSYIEDLDKEQARRGKTRRIGKLLQPLVNGLSQFTIALDVMIQAGPAPASLIYGGAKFVLHLAKGFTDYFEMMVDTLQEMGSMLECYHIFSTIYSTSDSMRHVMVNAYRNILVFWQKASRLFTRNGVKTFLKGIMRPFNSEWASLRSRLETDRARILAYAQAHEGEAAKRREETTERRELIKQEDQRNIKRVRLMTWLSNADDADAIDVRDHLDPLLQSKHRGTCEWLLQDTEFSSWMTSNASENLWLYASPGTGKSILCSSVVDKLKQQGLKVVYFFCSFQESCRRKISPILRSLALQLLSLQSEIPTVVEALYDAEMRQGQTKLRNEPVIIQVLQALIRQVDRVHIVIDGLDECEDRDKVLRLLAEMFTFQPLGLVKWLWSSRMEREFEELSRLLGSRKIEATKMKVQHDMKTFLEDSPDMAGNTDKSVDDWVLAADGNFLWLRLMLRTLSGCDLTCPSEVEEELTKFPSGLNGCYLRVLHQLLKKPPSYQRLARKLFLLVAFAAQPLTLCEVLDALAIREDSQDYQVQNKPFEHVVRQLCCPLILLDTSRANSEKAIVLRYFHKSTRDFFMQHPDSLELSDDLKQFFGTPEGGNLEMARICMRYLSYNRYGSPKEIDWFANDFTIDHCFARYAALYWYHHFYRAGSSVELYDLVHDFLQSPHFWTCLQVQASVAPYLFSRLTHGRGNRFAMTGLQTYDSEHLGYYASPLPTWLEDSEAGQMLLHSYTELIDEWHPLLLQHPRAVLECHPGVIGNQNIFSLDGLTAANMVIAIDPMSGIRAQSSPSDSKYQRTVLASQATKSGIRCYTLDRRQLSDGTDQLLRQLHINLESHTASIDTSIKEKRSWKVADLRDDSVIQLKSSDTADQQTLWTWDRLTYTCTKHQEDVSTIFKAPEEIIQALSALKSNELATPIQRHYTGYKTILALNILSDKVERSSDSGHGDDEDDGDSDVSISESDSESTAEEIHHDTYLRILIVIDGDHGPQWFHWTQRSEILMDYVPVCHPNLPYVLWPTSKTELRIANIDNHTTSTVPFLDGTVADSSEIVSRVLNFSTCGNLLHCLTTTNNRADDGLVTVSNLRLNTFSVNLAAQDPKEQLTQLSDNVTVNRDHMTQLAGDKMRVLISWTAKWADVVVNTPSSPCSLKLLRFHLPQQKDVTDPRSKHIETAVNSLYVPRSFSQRSPIFHTVHTRSDDHVIVILSSPSSKFASKEIIKGPPIMIWWPVSRLGGWRDWDETRDRRDKGLELAINSPDYLKGKYAASEQRFSVPIRSGLNWRKSCFVSCW